MRHRFKIKIEVKQGIAVIRSLVLVLTLSATLGLYSERLQRVMVLEVVNRTGDENLKYLEASISDAVREELKRKFAFNEIPVDTRNTLAAKNYIYPQDFDTETAAVNLGLLARQDIVVTGNFDSNGVIANSRRIAVNIRIISVTDKKILKTISRKATVDSSIFTTIQSIAAESAVEMEKILPNKDNFSRTSLVDNFYEGGLNQILLSFGASPSFFQSTTAIASGSQLSPADFNNLSVRAAYRRNSVYRENLYLEARGTFEFSSKKYAMSQTELADLTLPANHFGTRLSAPVGYRFALLGFLLVQPYAGPSTSFGSITLDAASSQIVVYDANRNVVTSLKKNYFGVGLISGIDFTFLLKSNLHLFTDIEYQMTFADSGRFSALGFFLGAGYRL